MILVLYPAAPLFCLLYSVSELYTRNFIKLSKGKLANIDPKSVEVTLNGRRLEQGTDYEVTPFTGEVTFLGEWQQVVGDPGADLEITFESRDRSSSPLIKCCS